VLGDERSGSGPDLFRVGRFIPGGEPSSVARSARGAGADARFGDAGRARCGRGCPRSAVSFAPLL